MERKKNWALAGLLIILLASFVLIAPTPVSAQENHHYTLIGGTLEAQTQLFIFPVSISPYATRDSDIKPLVYGNNITFTDPWFYNSTYGHLVNITVPSESFDGVFHEWYDAGSGIWFNLNHTLPQDGYGWIFLNQTSDVDCYTFNNNTGSYWGPESPKAGELAALTGNIPDLGSDGIAGTADDGFGDYTADPPGSSILILPSYLRCEFWADGSTDWELLFEMEWPIMFTTGTAYDIVDEPDSELDNMNYTRTGQPWEFYADLDHPGEYGIIPWGHGGHNAYVTYAGCWSMLEVYTGPDYQYLDVLYAILYRLVRDDLIVPDIKGENEAVTISDVRRAARAYDQYDEGVGEDGTPQTPPGGDDRPAADTNFDAAADVRKGDGYVGIADVRAIAREYETKITPTGIQPT
jgi:hypothetical protein